MKALMTLPALLLAANTWAACPAAKPETAPVVPDGATASFEDMAAAQEAVKTYVADMEAWLECRSNLHPLMHNRAIALAEAAAESYNMELSSFRKRDQLLGRIQERHGIAKDEAEKQVKAWEKRNPTYNFEKSQ